MRVLIVHRVGGAFGYITDGFVNALTDMGHTVARWDGNISTWNTFDPHIYIGCSGHKQDIPSNHKAKVAIHVNPYGPIDLKGINESKENIDWVISKHPDVVFGYGQECDRKYWSYWETKLNIPWQPMPTAADITVFHKTNASKTIDVVYLGGRWAYKGLTIDKYLIPLLHKGGFSYKIHGWGDWPSNICSGELHQSKANDFLNSGRIGPCIAEQHTHDYGIDIPERAFKIASCGTLVVHDNVQAIKNMIPSAVVAQTTSEFIYLCQYYIKREEERAKIAEQQRQEVLSAHTYHHRMRDLLQKLGQ